MLTLDKMKSPRRYQAKAYVVHFPWKMIMYDLICRECQTVVIVTIGSSRLENLAKSHEIYMHTDFSKFANKDGFVTFKVVRRANPR